ncbi:MAG TPA: arginine deiminase family protein [Blastocatellia bacterium]|nr:arginine deiminase family protein [Blastocatellia bacterium]
MSPRINECELTFVDRSRIDLQLATRQHEAYCATLEKLGVTVETLSANEQYPDACFVEDTAIVADEIAIICCPGVASRRAETELIERELAKHKKTARISLPATLDGGDVLRMGERFFVGQSRRTNSVGIDELARIVKPYGYGVTAVKTKGSLHLKSACTAIDDETLFVNPEWIDLAPLEGFNLVHTPPEEPWSANVLRVGETVCVQAGFPRAAELIRRLARGVEIIDTSELRKAEAGLTCSSIIFESAS